MYFGNGGLVEIIQWKDCQIQNLHLGKLNVVKRHGLALNSMSNSKQLLTAIASGEMQHPDPLLRVGLRKKRGLHGLLEIYSLSISYCFSC